MFEQDESMLRFGVTPVENLFIQEYLPAARGDYVKVYLYALYISAHPKKELSAAEIAQELGMPQSDVEGALRYWERRHLLVRLTDNPPAYQMKSPAQLLLSGGIHFRHAFRLQRGKGIHRVMEGEQICVKRKKYAVQKRLIVRRDLLWRQGPVGGDHGAVGVSDGGDFGEAGAASRAPGRLARHGGHPSRWARGIC